jgi:hypothetical protein
MAKIPLRMPMLPKETPTPIPIFRPVLLLVATSAVEIVVDCEEAEGILAVGRPVDMTEFTDGVGRTIPVITSLL